MYHASVSFVAGHHVRRADMGQVRLVVDSNLASDVSPLRITSLPQAVYVAFGNRLSS